jgi:inosine-uridine nucleoside N-ribohydrolase
VTRRARERCGRGGILAGVSAPIILDCDPGHDDAIALLLALASPEVRLLGVTTVAGNQTLAKTTANAIRVLDHVGRDDLAVAAGAARPLVRDPHVARDVHGESGLDGPTLPQPARAATTTHAIDWIAHAVENEPEPITLIATGPLTNVALLLARHPGPAARLRRIVLMGGAIGLGNVTPAAEFNIWADPEAAQRVLSGGGPHVTMVGLDVTHRALMTPAHAARLDTAGRAGRLVAELYRFYAGFHTRSYGWDGAPVHDAVALAYAIDPALLQTETCPIRVDTGTEPSRGRTYVDLHGVTEWTPDCDVAVEIDAERFLALLVERIAALG